MERNRHAVAARWVDVKKLVLGQDYLIGGWVANRLGHLHKYGDFTGIGVTGAEGIEAGVVFYDYHPGFYIFFHAASLEGKHWATREFLECCRSYCFDQLEVPRVCAWISSNNKKALRTAKRMGAVQEGLLAQAGPEGDDLVLVSFLRHNIKPFISEV